MKTKDILIFGAGAVGRVVGSHLRLLGCHVSFYVRPHHVDPLKENGIRLFNIQRNTELRLGAPDLLTQIPPDSHFDIIFLCVRSDQLDEAIPVLQAYYQNNEGGILVSAQPGRKDIDKLAQTLPQVAIVPMEPGFSAYMTPERLEYWFPKWLPSLIGAPVNETLLLRTRIVTLLNECGVPAKGVNDIEVEVRFPFSAGMPLLVAFELSDYSFDNLRENKKLLDLTAQGMREAVGLIKKELGFIPLKYRFFEHMTPGILSTALFMLDRLPQAKAIKKMWDIHSRKIHAQTYDMLDDLLTLGVKHKSREVALSTLAAMTPGKLDTHLKSVSVKNDKTPAIATGIAAGIGALLFWKILAGKKK